MRPMLLTATAALALSAGSAAAQDWERTATIYLWVPAVTMELQDKTDYKIERDEVIDDLGFGFPLEFTAARGDWVFGGELFFANNSRDGSLNFAVSPGEPDVDDIRGSDGAAELSTTMIQGFAGYKLYDRDDATFYGTFGLRYASMDAELDVETDTAAFSIDADASLFDAFVGLRGAANLGQNWKLPVVVDAGAGQSRYTFNMFAGLTYAYGQNDFTIGYRKLEWLLPDSNEYLNKVVYQGPVLSYSRRF